MEEELDAFKENCTPFLAFNRPPPPLPSSPPLSGKTEQELTEKINREGFHEDVREGDESDVEGDESEIDGLDEADYDNDHSDDERDRDGSYLRARRELRHASEENALELERLERSFGGMSSEEITDFLRRGPL